MSNPGTTDAAGAPGGGMYGDILARINEREWEIERILGEAHEAAASRLVAARGAAAETVAARRAEAARLAELAGEEALARAHREAAAIREAAAGDVAAILATPRERIDLAAERMLAIVLPALPGAGGAR